MPTTLFIAPPASSKTQQAIQRIREVNREAPPGSIWAILASDYQMHQFRQRLAQAGGAFGVEISTFQHFYHALLDRAGMQIQLLPNLVTFRLVRQVVEQESQAGRLSYYDPIREKAGFINLLIERFGELKRALVMPEDFLTGTSCEPPAVHEIALLYQSYQEKLRQMGWADAEGLSWLAVEALEQQPSLASHLRLVVVDGFTDFSGAQLRALALLGRSVQELWISLPGEAGSTRLVDQRFLKSLVEVQEVFQSVPSSLPIKIIPGKMASSGPLRPPPKSQRPEILSFLADNLFEPAVPPPGTVSDNLVMLESPSPEEESREALRWLKALILRQGLLPQECAIFTTNPDQYAAPLKTVAQEFGMPLYLSTGLPPLSQTPVGTALQTLLQLPLEDFSRRPFLDCLRSPFFTFESWGLLNADAGKVENLSARFRLLSGRQSWLDALEHLAKETGQDAEFDPVEDEANPPPSLPGGTEAGRLKNALTAWFDSLSPPVTLSLTGWVSWLEQLLVKASFFDRCGKAESDALKEIFNALALGEDLFGPVETSFPLFLQELFSSMDSLPVVEPLRRQNNRIFAARLLEARGLRFKAVVLLGLSEGIFPEVEKADPFLGEDLRRRFRLEPRLGRYQPSLFYQAVTRADQYLLLTRPYLAEGGEAWVPSFYWQQIGQLFEQAGGADRSGGADRFGGPDQFARLIALRLRKETVRDLSQAASRSERLFFAARQEVKGAGTPGLAAEPNLQVSNSVLAARLAATAAGPYEGQPEGLAGLTGEFTIPGYTWSASSLETYGSCPFRYYIQRCLQLTPKTPPQPGLDAAQLGSLYHAILQQAYQFAEDPSDSACVLQAMHTGASEIFAKAPEQFKFAPDPLWEQQQTDMLMRLEKTILTLGEVSLGWQPMAYEQVYGYGASPALELQTEAGVVRMHGFIDRLDRDEQGRLRVIDYKTGSSGLDKKDLLEGKRLQLPLYALAATQALGFGEVVDGFYWSIHAASAHLKLGKFAADTSDGEWVGVEGAIALTLAHVERIVDGVRQAKFSPIPPAGGCPEYCPAAAWCWRYAPNSW